MRIFLSGLKNFPAKGSSIFTKPAMYRGLCISVLIFFAVIAYAQTPLATNTFNGSPFPGTSWASGGTYDQYALNQNTPYYWCSAYPNVNYCAHFDSYENANGTTVILYTPAFSLVGYSAATLSIDLINYGTNNGFVIWGSINGGASWQATNIATNPTTGSATTFTTLTYPLGATYLGQSNVMIAFVCTSNYGDSRCDNDVFLDNVGVTGVNCTPPTTQASSLSTSSVASTTATVSLGTRGNGTGGVIIVAYPGTSAGATPVSGASYTANVNYTSGTAVGTGYTVYNGNASAPINVNVTGLTANTQYTFVAYEYNTTGTCYDDATTGSTTVATNCSSSTAFSTTSPVTFTTSGCYVVPTGVTSLTTVACYGGGGGGGGASTVDDGDGSGAGGGGGGGGAYAGASSISVTPGQTIYVSVGGAGSGGGAGANGTAGGTSYVSYNGSIIAEAAGGSFGYGASAPDGSMIYGAAGTGGTTVIGSTTHTGGNGAAGSGPGSPWGAVYGGGGGGGAGSTGNGGTATANSNAAGTAGAGGGGVGGTGGHITSGSEDGGSAGASGATWGAGGGGGAGESDDADNQSVAGANGKAGTVIFTFTYATCTNPTINTQPASPAPVCAGTGTSFAVSASGTALSYQWQVSTTGSSGTYTPISNSTVYGTTGIDIYSGVTTNTLTVNMALSTMNTYWYECVVSSSGGCPVTTTAAELQVSTPAVLNTAPGSITNTGATINGTN